MMHASGSALAARLATLSLGLAIGAIGLVLGAPTHAAAQPSGAPVPGEVMIILANPAEGAIDEALQAVPALRQPPFSTFGSMRLLSRPRFRLQGTEPRRVRLPNGRTLQIELLEVTSDGRFRVRISINRQGQNDYLPLLQVMASPGEPFFVAGQSFQDGTLVLGIRLGERLGEQPAAGAAAERPAPRAGRPRRPKVSR